MIVIDIIIILLILFFGIKGYSKGFLYSILRFVGGLLSLIIAMQFSDFVANKIFDSQDSMLKLAIPAISFVITLVFAYLLVNIGLRVILKPVNQSSLSGINKVLGALTYSFLICIAFGSLLWLFQSIGILNTQALEGSYVSVYLLPLMPSIFDTLGQLLPIVKQSFLNVNEYFDNIAESL